MDCKTELSLELQDTEWPFTFTDHRREIVRAVVFDDSNNFYFMRVLRDDGFGQATLIETSGGGVEPGESLETAIKRELKEELGVEAEVLSKIGTVSDYYNYIHRHNINHYFLCKIKAFGEKQLTKDEREKFQLSTLNLTLDEALEEYRKCSDSKLGRLLSNRETPILERAKALMEQASCQG